MTADRKARGDHAMRKSGAKADQVKGAIKETLGRAVGNERMTAEGRATRAKGDMREAGAKTRDAFKR